MFTGIIEETGTVAGIKRGGVSSQLTLRGNIIFDDLKLGDSVAVNGVCLTAGHMTENTFTADVMAETLRRSSLGQLAIGSSVNLERAMPAYGRFGGHIVSGHIDGTGKILSMTKEENAVWVHIGTEQKLLRYMVEKGSAAIDGISLTIAELDQDSFKVSIIPHTGTATTLLDKKPGDIVNLENDVIGKYVERLLKADPIEEKKEGISLDFLKSCGF